MRFDEPLNSFTSVGPGQTAQTRIGRDRRIHAILLESGTDDATALGCKIREVRLVYGTTQLWRLSPAQIIALNAYRGIPFAAGSLELYFSDPAMRTPVGEESTALNAYNLTQDLILEVEYKTNAEYAAATGTPGDTFTPTLKGLVEFDNVNDTNRAFVKRGPITITNAAANDDLDITTLPRTGAYKAIHLFTTLVDRVYVRRDGVLILDRTVAQITNIGRRNGLTPQAGHLPIDFCTTNQATDALEMTVAIPDGKGGLIAKQVETFLLKLKTNAGGNIPAVVEQVITL